MARGCFRAPGRGDRVAVPSAGLTQRYAQRLVAGLQRLFAGPTGPRPVRALIPPGSADAESVSAFLESVTAQRMVLDCRRLTAQRVLEQVADLPAQSCVLLFPELLPAAALHGLLVAERDPVSAVQLCIGERPFWLGHGGGRAPEHYLLDYRAFLYTDTELQSLLQASPLGAQTDAGDPQALTRHELRRLTQGWPGLTEAALADLAVAAADDGSVDGHAARAIARLPAARAFFAAGWLPLLARAYPWLRHACRLPLLNLDLLSALVRDIGAGVQECLHIGWLERVPATAGAYCLESVLDQFLLAEEGDAANHRFLEEAAAWYEAHGHVSEAIECWASVGLAAERAAAILQRHAPDGRAGLGVVPSVTKAMRVLAGASMTAARQGLEARAPGPRIAALPAARQPVVGALPGSPALQHVLKAISFYQTSNEDDASRSLGEAMRAGIQPRQISKLIDFVDIHLRPMLKPAPAAGPLAGVFSGLRHAGPARQSLRQGRQALNHRELQILEFICQGLGNKEISALLGLELSTVKWYGTRIYEKLEVRSRTQAIAKARSQGLVD